MTPPAASAPFPTVEEGMREAVATPAILDGFPGLMERIIGAFGKAAWVNKAGISAHGSEDGGQIAMNHSGWEVLPALLNEALSPIASALAARERERDEARAERDVERKAYEVVHALARRSIDGHEDTFARLLAAEAENAKMKAERAACDRRIRAQRAVLRAAWPPGTLNTISATRARIYAAARDRLRTIRELRAENATLRASAERMEAAATLALAELDWQVAASAHCGDPNHECPMQDIHAPSDGHSIARSALRAALTPKEPNDG